MSQRILALEGDELLSFLREATKEAVQVEKVAEQMESVERDIRIWQNQPIEGLSIGGRIGWWFVYYFLCAMAGGVISLVVGEGAVIFAIFGSMLILSPILTHKKHRKKMEEAQNLYSANIVELKIKLSEIGNELDSTIDKACDKIWIILEEYRYSLALETMSNYVLSQRATVWKECVNYYEEQKHRWNMESNSAEAMRLQKQILMANESTAESANAAALFAGIAAVASLNNNRRN